MAQHRLSKLTRIILITAGGVLLIIASALLTGWLDAPIARLITEISQRQMKSSWPGYFRTGGMILLVMGVTLLLGEQLIDGLKRLAEWSKTWVESVDQQVAEKTKGLMNVSQTNDPEWPLNFNRWDVLIILFFVLIAFIYQLAMMSPGYPTVILGGDAANIASFAAGRAFPEMFKQDAILGNLNNIGLYVTVHLPLAIWLEKMVGNFGLAYSLLLFPHVFLQYFSYYLLGRVLYHNRYWALLFSVATSAPLMLDGGEVWGVVADAMPRFTFQVLIPFVLILLLTIWREKPSRWLWAMVIAGLMAFIHPVSTPVWAFALWLGFWPMFPFGWSVYRKIQEMFKLGGILTLSLLPYISIYLTYHQSGSGRSNYDLVHYILVEYFPANILNIPAAVKTLLYNTAQFGLLWYGLAGLIITALLFRSERLRLKQLLVWMAGIAFVSILIPWVEITIESALRMIPLQTELMRGMRYLVPFLFIFWFYPFAKLTHQSMKIGFTHAVFVVGTVLTLSWLMMNPPEPFTHASYVFNCWQSGRFICPSSTDHADALLHIRTDTPADSKFTVFLTNRWSGIEVRYLGLRPMVYAYKDKGQLLFTNIESLEQWNTYQQREDEIFGSKRAPTLDDKRVRIVKFAREAAADYILTDFPFPPEVQHQLGVIAIYQNQSYSILKTYATHP